MGDKVFINGRSAVHAGSPGKSMAFPDVNLCPPTPPAGPVPLPLPNIAQAADLQGGAESVTIGGNPMGKQSSFFAKSTGNESAQSTGGGVVSHVVQGKAYFVSYSVDVTIEGEPAVRHLDMMTHNHAAQSPPNAAMGTYLGTMDPAVVGQAKPPKKKRKDDGKPQDIEFYVEHTNGNAPEGIDGLHFVSDDGRYDKSLPLTGGTQKGNLLSLKFEKVLPGKSYSLYLMIGGTEVPFFEHVHFRNILDEVDGQKANIVGNRDFQFVEAPSAPPNLTGIEDDGTLDLATVRKPYRMTCMTQPPMEFQPIANRSIYVFEVSANQKAILAWEYIADDKGMLSVVSGRKRRLCEVKDAPKGEPVPAATLPLVRQGERLSYAFVAIRGRLDRWAISDMENGLDQIFRWFDPCDDGTFAVSDGTRYLSVVDPLTIALSLNAAYQGKLDKALKYTVATPENEHREVVLERSLKFELARKIRDNLLTDAYGNRVDPQEIADKHLAKAESGKLELDEYIDTELNTLANLEAERNKAANKVILFLESGLWDKVQAWYLGRKLADIEIGHQWVGAELRALSRLNETKAGKAYLQRLASDKDNNVLSYVFHPGVEEGERWQRFLHRCAIGRKAITAVAISFMDTAPAIIVAYRGDLGPRLVQLTLDFQFGQERTLLAEVGRRGFVTRTLGYKESLNYEKLDHYKAKAKLDEWLGEEKKAHWPKDSTPGKIAHLVTYVFAAVEIANAVIKIMDMVKKFKKRPAEPGEQALATAEAVAAALDVVVALEDPVRELAHQLHAAHAAGAGAHAGGAAAGSGAAAASQSQAKGLVEKLKGGPAFKLIGAAAATIDMFVYYFEARTAYRKGEKALSAGNALVSGGSLLMAVGSAMNAVGMAGDVALLAAASTVIIVAAVLVTLVGFIVINEFSKTEWQAFARYCCFGKKGQDGSRTPHHGHESWSGGDFSEWTPDVYGLDRQTEVFMGLLCAFQVAGDKDDEHRIMVTFGAIPPRGKLHVRFSIKYETDEVKKPEYVVDLENPKWAIPSGDAKADGKLDLTIHGPKLSSLRLRATPLVNSRVKDASCEVVLRYAPKADSQVASGTIPVEGEFKVEFVRDGYIDADAVSSTDVEPEARRPPNLPPAPRSWPSRHRPFSPAGSSE